MLALNLKMGEKMINSFQGVKESTPNSTKTNLEKNALEAQAVISMTQNQHLPRRT